MVADGKPHTVLMTRTEGSIEILLNNSFVNRTTTTSSNRTITLNVSSDHLFLGAEVDVKTGEVVHGFTGCLMGVRLDRKEIPFTDMSNEDFTVVKFPPSGVLPGCPLQNVVESNQPALYVYAGIAVCIAGVIVISVAFVISCASLNTWRQSRLGEHEITRCNNSPSGSPRQSGFFWQPTLHTSAPKLPPNDKFELINTTNGASNSSLLEPQAEVSETNLFSTSNSTFLKPDSQVVSVSTASFQTIPVPSKDVNRSNPGYLTSTPISSDQDDGGGRGTRSSRDMRSSLLHQSVQSVQFPSSNIPKAICVPPKPQKIPNLSKRVDLANADYEESEMDEMKHFNEEGPYEPLGSIGSLHDIVFDLDRGATCSAKPTTPAQLPKLKISTPGQQSSPAIIHTNVSPVKSNPPPGQEDRPDKDITNIGRSQPSLGLLPSEQHARFPITHIIDGTPKKLNQLVEVQPPKPPKLHEFLHTSPVKSPLSSQQIQLPLEKISPDKKQKGDLLLSSDNVFLDGTKEQKNHEGFSHRKEEESRSRDKAQRLNKSARKSRHKTEEQRRKQHSVELSQ